MKYITIYLVQLASHVRHIYSSHATSWLRYIYINTLHGNNTGLLDFVDYKGQITGVSLLDICSD